MSVLRQVLDKGGDKYLWIRNRIIAKARYYKLIDGLVGIAREYHLLRRLAKGLRSGEQPVLKWRDSAQQQILFEMNGMKYEPHHHEPAHQFISSPAHPTPQ